MNKVNNEVKKANELSIQIYSGIESQELQTRGNIVFTDTDRVGAVGILHKRSRNIMIIIHKITGD